MGGQCRRCCFFPKGRCTNGYRCSFCHFAHVGICRSPKSKKKRARRKKERRSFADQNPTLASQIIVSSLRSTQALPEVSWLRQGTLQAGQPQHKTSRLIVHD